MKSRTKVVLAIAAAFGLGGAVVEGLHAQAKAKPQIYAVTEINVKNADGYMKEYAPKAQALIKKSGGKLLAASSSPTKIEGNAPAPRVSIQLWENMDQYMAYRKSAELKEVRKIGDKHADFRTFAVEARPQ
jgi:uncharacterized protein (DUF1330 family)